METAAASWQFAQAALAHGDMLGARRHLVAVLQVDPQNVYARVLLAGTVLAQGRMREAVDQLRIAAKSVGANPEMVYRVAQALLRVGENRDLHELLKRQGTMTGTDAAALAALAHVYQALGESKPALLLMQQAQALGCRTPDFLYFLGVQLQFNGELESAEKVLEQCLQLRPSYGRAALTLSRLRRQTVGSNHVDVLQRELAKASADSEDQAGLSFALYKELEDLGDIAGAWRALEQANATMQRRLRHDIGFDVDMHAQLAAMARNGIFNEEQWLDDGPQPIFIVGMPRSGTTVLERMLGNHSQVASGGELGDFAHQLRWEADLAGHTLLDPALLQRLPSLDYAAIGRGYLHQTRWRAQGKHWFIDKLPANYQLVGMIARALPQAVIVHMQRDPMAVCFSNYRAMFGDSYSYSYDFLSLARHHQAYTGLMEAWREALPGRIVDIDYREMVQSPESVVRRILMRCELPVEAGISDLTRNQAASSTLSTVQIREPVHTRNVDEWQRYAAELEPLRRLMEK